MHKIDDRNDCQVINNPSV